MATLKARRDKWYARVIWFVNGKFIEKQIPLRTSSKVTARERIAEVEKVEGDIKQGMEFSFPWLSNFAKTKVKRFTIKEAVDQWLLKRKGKVANSTLDLNEDGLNYFLKFMGNANPIETISTSSAKQFIDWLEGRGLSKASINIHLRTIKSMFRYYLNVGRLSSVPHIQQLRIPKTEPIYITDNEFQSIMELDWLDGFYKRVFLMYRETGMRLNEPMISVLDGDWIDIPNTSK